MATTVDTLVVRKGVTVEGVAPIEIRMAPRADGSRPVMFSMRQLDADTVGHYVAGVTADGTIIGPRKYMEVRGAQAGERIRVTLFDVDLDFQSGSRLLVGGQEVRPPNG